MLLDLGEAAAVSKNYIIKQLIMFEEDPPSPASRPFIRVLKASAISGPFEA
jgi:hypothetical protein